MEENGQPHDSATLHPRKDLPVSMKEEAGWAPEVVWMFWRRVNSPGLAGNKITIPWLSGP